MCYPSNPPGLIVGLGRLVRASLQQKDIRANIDKLAIKPGGVQGMAIWISQDMGESRAGKSGAGWGWGFTPTPL